MSPWTMPVTAGSRSNADEELVSWIEMRAAPARFSMSAVSIRPSPSKSPSARWGGVCVTYGVKDGGAARREILVAHVAKNRTNPTRTPGSRRTEVISQTCNVSGEYGKGRLAESSYLSARAMARLLLAQRLPHLESAISPLILPRSVGAHRERTRRAPWSPTPCPTARSTGRGRMGSRSRSMAGSSSPGSSRTNCHPQPACEAET